MTQGKNKRISKGGKGGKRKSANPFTKKEWYTLRAPVPFSNKQYGWTTVTKTQGTKIASEQLKGRVFEVSYADLNQNSENYAWRKVKLVIDEVHGKNCLTSFYGMDITRDKLNKFIHKWKTLIESTIEAKTQDGYILRIFVVAFTSRLHHQKTKTSYASSAQTKAIRKKISAVILAEASKGKIEDFVSWIMNEGFQNSLQNECRMIYPIENPTIRKIKVLKRPKMDATKVSEIHNDKGAPRATNQDEGEAANLVHRK
jgi:small subunit ribosomal protein S3Ae